MKISLVFCTNDKWKKWSVTQETCEENGSKVKNEKMKSWRPQLPLEEPTPNNLPRNFSDLTNKKKVNYPQRLYKMWLFIITNRYCQVKGMRVSQRNRLVNSATWHKPKKFQKKKSHEEWGKTARESRAYKRSPGCKSTSRIGSPISSWEKFWLENLGRTSASLRGL